MSVLMGCAVLAEPLAQPGWSSWGGGGLGELCPLLQKWQRILWLRQDSAPTALGLECSNCSCKLSATCSPCPLSSPCQQLIFILIPALCHSQRVFQTVFSLSPAPPALFISTAQTPRAVTAVSDLPCPSRAGRGSHQAGTRCPAKGQVLERS